jgi:hypothetical protein
MITERVALTGNGFVRLFAGTSKERFNSDFDNQAESKPSGFQAGIAPGITYS